MPLTKIEKITKENIVSDAINQASVDCKPYKMMKLLNQFIDFLKFDIFGNNSTVLVSGLGRLTPKIKKGGRKVRNPINGEEKLMPEIATVTLTKRFSPNSQQKRYTEKQLVNEFLEQNDDLACDKISTTAIIEAFFNSIRKVSENENLRLEIRGFGMFSSKKVEESLSRNPKTGEAVIVDAHLKPHFKISGNLKQELYKRLKETL